MNHIRLIPLLLISMVSAYAQILTPVEVITKDGSAVILKPDGTWEFKKAVPQSARIPAVNLDKAEVSTDSLPSNFTGVDPKILHERLINLRKQLFKNEFETTAQYNKRVAEEIQKPIIGNLTIKDNFSFVVPVYGARYDADTQKMRLVYFVKRNHLLELGRARPEREGSRTANSKDADLNIKDVDLGRANLYGITWGSGGSIGIFFDEVKEGALKTISISSFFETEVTLDVEEAKRLKDTVKAAVVVKLDKPYTDTQSFRYNFQVRPIEFYFFDSQKGVILGEKFSLEK